MDTPHASAAPAPAAPAASKPRASIATSAATATGAVLAAIAASACCVGPLVLALLGIGGAGFLVALEPYRPLFSIVTVALLGAGWFLALRRRAPAVQGPSHGAAVDGAVEADACGCELPRANKTGRRLLWIATVVALLALAFPYLTPYLF